MPIYIHIQELLGTTWNGCSFKVDGCSCEVSREYTPLVNIYGARSFLKIKRVEERIILRHSIAYL